VDGFHGSHLPHLVHNRPQGPTPKFGDLSAGGGPWPNEVVLGQHITGRQCDNPILSALTLTLNRHDLRNLRISSLGLASND
jgi:hypothetical protein